MAINDFNRAFGTKNNAAAPAAGERVKSQFWINVGYETDMVDENTGNKRFVSLVQGVPVDGQERLKTNSSNHEYAAFNAARNDLLDQIMEVANKLKPGQETLLNLQIQLRRVNEDVADAPTADNKFARKLNLLG